MSALQNMEKLCQTQTFSEDQAKSVRTGSLANKFQELLTTSEIIWSLLLSFGGWLGNGIESVFHCASNMESLAKFTPLGSFGWFLGRGTQGYKNGLLFSMPLKHGEIMPHPDLEWRPSKVSEDWISLQTSLTSFSQHRKLYDCFYFHVGAAWAVACRVPTLV